MGDAIVSAFHPLTEVRGLPGGFRKYRGEYAAGGMSVLSLPMRD